jgi:GINS complex subunit 4
MVDTPDLDTAVFVRLLRDTMVESKGVDADGALEGKDGAILILRWSDAKPMLEKGDAELV